MIVNQKLKLPLVILDVGLILIIGFILAGVVFYPKVDIQSKDTPTLSRVESQLAESPIEATSEAKKAGKDSKGKVAGTEDIKGTPKVPEVVKKPLAKKTASANHSNVPTSEPTTTEPTTKEEVEENETPPLGFVEMGDTIAYQGSTGCTTGSHLHFATYLNGTNVNPITYLDSGEFIWPLANPTVTQFFGENYEWWMRNFGLPGHNGIDMTEYEGAPIYAVADGILTHSSDSGACSITGTVGKGVIIDHGEGLKTIYWHVQ